MKKHGWEDQAHKHVDSRIREMPVQAADTVHTSSLVERETFREREECVLCSSDVFWESCKKHSNHNKHTDNRQQHRQPAACCENKSNKVINPFKKNQSTDHDFQSSPLQHEETGDARRAKLVGSNGQRTSIGSRDQSPAQGDEGTGTQGEESFHNRREDEQGSPDRTMPHVQHSPRGGGEERRTPVDATQLPREGIFRQEQDAIWETCRPDLRGDLPGRSRVLCLGHRGDQSGTGFIAPEGDGVMGQTDGGKGRANVLRQGQEDQGTSFDQEAVARSSTEPIIPSIQPELGVQQSVIIVADSSGREGPTHCRARETTFGDERLQAEEDHSQHARIEDSSHIDDEESEDEELLRTQTLNKHEVSVLKKKIIDDVQHVWHGLIHDVGCLLFEVGCSPASILSQTVFEITKRETAAVRCSLWNGCDLSTSEGVMNIVKQLKQLKPKHVWLSPDCGPFSPLQRCNQRNEQQKQALHEKRQYAIRMYEGAAIVARQAFLLGCEVHWEFAARCDAWRLPVIQDLVTDLDLCKGKCSGCQVGLRDPKSQVLMCKA